MSFTTEWIENPIYIDEEDEIDFIELDEGY